MKVLGQPAPAIGAQQSALGAQPEEGRLHGQADR
jgi:hypothetical protein